MNNRRKFRYIKIKDDEPKKAAPAVKKKKSRTMKNIGNALTVVGTTISAILLVFVIMICIVVTVITVYILDFADNSYDINLRDMETKFTTMIYGYNEEGQEVERNKTVSGWITRISLRTLSTPLSQRRTSVSTSIRALTGKEPCSRWAQTC